MSDNIVLPIIKLEVRGLKFAVEKALGDYAQTMLGDLQAAVDAACSPEAVEAVVRVTAEKEMKAAIEREIRTFFAYGSGAKFVAEAVRTELEKNMSYYQQHKEDRS